jgi:hypothetical protein
LDATDLESIFYNEESTITAAESIFYAQNLSPRGRRVVLKNLRKEAKKNHAGAIRTPAVTAHRR